MRTLEEMRSNPKDHVCWGYYNLGRFMGAERTKRDAKAAAKKWIGKPWCKIKDQVEIHKIIITALKNPT